MNPFMLCSYTAGVILIRNNIDYIFIDLVQVSR